jgi:hypothetical protein
VKKNLLLLCLLLAIAFHSAAQKWEGDRKVGLWKLYSINANAGFLSYFGDLSQYDTDPLNKLKHESNPAFSVIVTKHILNKFGISGQILYGRLEGSNPQQQFNTSILEYNLHVRTDLVNLVFSGKEHRIGFSPYAGIGQFIFTTQTTSYRNELATTSEIRSRVPEFVYFAGAGLSCKLPHNLAATADLSLRQCRNDKLDGLVKNDNYDYYSYLNLGLTYRISSIARQPLKNKARLAHNEQFLSHKKRIRNY